MLQKCIIDVKRDQPSCMQAGDAKTRTVVQRIPGYNVEMLERYYTIGYRTGHWSYMIFGALFCERIDYRGV